MLKIIGKKSVFPLRKVKYTSNTNKLNRQLDRQTETPLGIFEMFR